MYDLTLFSLGDMIECSSGVRTEAAGAASMEAAAGAIVRHFYANLIDKDTGEPALALVRFYKTHPFDELERALQDVAAGAAGSPAGGMAGVNCLTLMASVGDEPGWNDRHTSRAHRAIPLLSQQALDELPMVQQLVLQLGVDPAHVVRPDPQLFRALDEASYNVFYVPEAAGSAHVPAQTDFVERYGIRSVLGFGGALPSGGFFAVVLFSRTFIPAATADAFAAVALSVKLAVLPFVGGPVFDGDPPPPAADADRELKVLRSEVAALEQLLAVRQRAVMTQAARLEQAVRAAEERTAALIASQAALAASEAHMASVVASALDGIITMDAGGLIAEVNPAAERIFDFRAEDVVGQPLADLIIPPALREGHRAGLAQFLATGEGAILGQRVEITGMRADGELFPVELAVAAIPGARAPEFTGFIRDITARLEAENELVESRARFAHIAMTLQNSLLPPVLPEVPGVEVAAVYRPAGTGNDVGGDFYDAFEIGRNEWAFILGDVEGKGAEAAALTGLVRYTVRAAAMRTRKPSAVLATLNAAVHRQHPDRFCTVAVVRLKLGSGAARLSAASGGHPSPLVLSPDGTIRETAASGLLVGPFPTWSGSDRHTRLHEGDVVVFFSDGVTEARNSSEQFGETRLRAVLAEHRGAAAATVASAIEDAVLAHAPVASDDIAILVLRMQEREPSA